MALLNFHLWNIFLTSVALAMRHLDKSGAVVSKIPSPTLSSDHFDLSPYLSNMLMNETPLATFQPSIV